MSLGTPAFAGEAEAEHVRLQNEIGSLVARSAWRGADRVYEQMVALRLPLTFDDHWLGAQTAKALGNVNDTHVRLKAAEALGPTELLYEELAQLYAAYGMVKVKVSKDHEQPVLRTLEMPFDPVMARTIDAARVAVEADNAYDGLLPLGRYEVAGTRFDVIGEPLVKIKVR